MKEATGEVSMTTITIVAIAVIGGILAAMWPTLQTWIQSTFTAQRSCPTGMVLQNGNCVRR